TAARGARQSARSPHRHPEAPRGDERTRTAHRGASHAPRQTETVIAWPKYRADAVGICHRIERPVELAAAQADARFERSPGTLDLRQLVCDSHEHDIGRLTNNDVLRAHAHNVQPLRAST